MEKLIKKTFIKFFGKDVRMINLNGDKMDMGIYIVRDKKIAKLSEKALAEYSPDYVITRTGKDFDSWTYMVATHHEGVVRNNELVSLPETTYQESVSMYKTAEKTLQELVVSIVRDDFNNLMIWWSYEKE